MIKISNQVRIILLLIITMNPILLKDLILAGHRVACKLIIGQWKVFLRTNWQWKFQWQSHWISIEDAIEKQLSGTLRSDWSIRQQLTWEYKIVTPLPQLPQVWDTVEVLDICRELPWFDERSADRKNMVWKKYRVERLENHWVISIGWYFLSPRMVAKCEPEKEQSIQSEEQFWDEIIINWVKYIKAI